jgi:hypothetical protein
MKSFHKVLVEIAASKDVSVSQLLRDANIMQQYTSSYRQRTVSGSCNIPKSAYDELVKAFPQLADAAVPSFTTRDLPSRIASVRKKAGKGSKLRKAAQEMAELAPKRRSTTERAEDRNFTFLATMVATVTNQPTDKSRLEQALELTMGAEAVGMTKISQLVRMLSNTNS